MDKPFYVSMTSRRSGDFTAVFQDTVRLAVPYEVAIVDLVYTVSWQNMEEVVYKIITAAEPTVQHEVIVPKGFYRNIKAWLEVWHHYAPTGLKQYVTVGKELNLGQYILTVGKDTARAEAKEAKLLIPEYARQVLQVNGRELTGVINRYADMHIGKNFFLLEGDFVDKQYYNDELRPLLFMTRLQFYNLDYCDDLDRSPLVPKFIPVNTNELRRLTIETYFDNREKPYFQRGYNHCVLCFRPRVK